MTDLPTLGIDLPEGITLADYGIQVDCEPTPDGRLHLRATSPLGSAAFTGEAAALWVTLLAMGERLAREGNAVEVALFVRDLLDQEDARASGSTSPPWGGGAPAPDARAPTSSGAVLLGKDTTPLDTRSIVCHHCGEEIRRAFEGYWFHPGVSAMYCSGPNDPDRSGREAEPE